jgi:hypothetical protein
MLLMFVSILVIAMPIGVIGGEFSELYRSNDKRKALKQKKKEAQAQALGLMSAGDLVAKTGDGFSSEAPPRPPLTESATATAAGAVQNIPSDEDAVRNLLLCAPSFSCEPEPKTREEAMQRLSVINFQVGKLMQESNNLLLKLNNNQDHI